MNWKLILTLFFLSIFASAVPINDNDNEGKKYLPFTIIEYVIVINNIEYFRSHQWVCER